MQFYSDPSRERDPYSLPDCEVFYVSAKEAAQNADLEQAGYGSCREPGFYYWHCFPGCLPDSDPQGPFETEAKAIADAQEAFTDFDAQCDEGDALDAMLSSKSTWE